MEVEMLKKEQYEAWDRFCLLSDQAWFWHTTSWLIYQLNYSEKNNPRSFSFLIKENNRIIAICPLILETIAGHHEFSCGSGFGPTPACANDLSKRNKEKILKFIFSQIDSLAKENQVKRIRMKFSVLDKSSIEGKNFQFNYLMKYGFLDATINTQIINLVKPIKELKSEVRHGHDADINRADKILTAHIFDKKNISEEIFNCYVELHHLAAGRTTRPKLTFDIMFNLIKSGNAFLAGVKKDDLFIGFSYFFVYKGNVYYGSSCNHPGHRDLPIAHYLQWRAIEYMNKEGYSIYEIGWQSFSQTLSDFPSEKEINIAKFKRGFGGETAPLFRGEKYYDKNYFLSVYEERIKKYADNLK